VIEKSAGTLTRIRPIFPITRSEIPISLVPGIPWQLIEFVPLSDTKIATQGEIWQNSHYFSHLSGNLRAETGWRWTASSTTQSAIFGIFLGD
jgi:hypothetical protein